MSAAFPIGREKKLNVEVKTMRDKIINFSGYQLSALSSVLFRSLIIWRSTTTDDKQREREEEKMLRKEI